MLLFPQILYPPGWKIIAYYLLLLLLLLEKKRFHCKSLLVDWLSIKTKLHALPHHHRNQKVNYLNICNDKLQAYKVGDKAGSFIGRVS